MENRIGTVILFYFFNESHCTGCYFSYKLYIYMSGNDDYTLRYKIMGYFLLSIISKSTHRQQFQTFIKIIHVLSER